MKTKQTYSVTQLCEDVANALRDRLRGRTMDYPMIRTALNDQADAMGKDGYQVNFNFDQSWAVKRVVKLINQ